MMLIDPADILKRGPPGQLPVHAGVLVQDALTGETLLAWNEREAFTPASTTKLVTTATALYTLGEDFTFRTAVLASGVSGGSTNRLILRGTGDPSLRERGDGNTLETLARGVAAREIRTVEELRVNDFAFSQARWGQGWMWDDAEYPIGALRLDDDEGALFHLDAVQASPHFLTDVNALPLRVGERFAALLRENGVQVGSIKRERAEVGDTALLEVTSAPLINLIRRVNKESDNIYAEQLRAALGLKANGAPSSEETATLNTTTFLKAAGYDFNDYRLRDGSGLTRYNLLSPRLLNTVLRFTFLNPKGTNLPPLEAFRQKKNLFIESLPVAGTGEATPEARANGGTLRNRLKNTGLDVRAKTGSMTGVSSLSGFLTAQSGRVLAFTIMMDNFPGERSDLQAWQDELIRALAAKY